MHDPLPHADHGDGDRHQRLDRPFYDPPRMVISTFDGGARTVEAGDNPHPYGHEVDEVARCLRAGARESERMTWADTIAIMELMDDAREQVGVRYAADGAKAGPA